MSSLELSEWLAYSRIEPIGREQRADLRAGIIASTVANSQRVKGTAYKAQDFMPFPPSLPKVSPVEAVQEFKRMIKGLNRG